MTDEQWEIIKTLIPEAKPGGRPRMVDMREIINGIFYILVAGCAWYLLPHDFPKWKTVYHYFRQWHALEKDNGLREYQRCNTLKGFPPCS